MKREEVSVVAKVISGAIRNAIEPLKKRIAALEARAEATKYCGIWTNQKVYQRGNFVTHAGGIWHANEETQDKPGASNSWVLAVKSGDR